MEPGHQSTFHIIECTNRTIDAKRSSGPEIQNRLVVLKIKKKIKNREREGKKNRLKTNSESGVRAGAATSVRRLLF